MKQLAAVFSFCFMLLSSALFGITAEASALEDTKDLIKQYYVGKINGNLDEAKTVEELTSYLDVHSVAYTAEEYEAFINSVNQETIGIGIIIEKHPQGVFISNVVNGGSAQANGIVAGDIITHVNGVNISEYTVNEASAVITGPANTIVQLTVLKVSGETVNYHLLRKKFSVENVTSKLLYGNIGYIAFASFSQSVDQEITSAYNKLKEQGATSFIVDVRNNGGGYVDTAKKVIGMFPDAVLAYTDINKLGAVVIEADTQNANRAIFPANTKLLVNSWSASASDMLAAALKDQKAAYLYGTTTYGKGTMQGFFSVNNGEYIIKLTMAEFRSPYGNKIDGIGITPHKETDIPLQEAHLESLLETYKNYKALPKMADVAPTKTFKINFSKAVSSAISPNDIELVELGGQKIATEITHNGNSLIIKPTKALTKGSHYALFVHPSVKSSNNKNIKQGIHMHITVAK